MHLIPTDTGKIYKIVPGSTERTEIDLPADLALRAFPTWTDWVLMAGVDRLIITGRWNAPAVWIPSLRKFWRAGIIAPLTPPVIAASGTGLTQIVIGKYTFAEMTEDQIIHESNPSPSSNILTLANQGVAWSGLPTEHSNPRVTHKRLYRSVDGDDYAYVATVPLADATYNESVTPLGAAMSERRGPPPEDAKYVTCYGRRCWYATGDDTFWFSEIDEPESVHLTNNLKTLDDRFVTMLRGLTDQLAVGTRRSFQDVQGWSTADFNVRMVSQDIGCISNRGSKVVNDKLWFPAQDGYFRFGGGFQFLMKNLRTWFRTGYESEPESYEGMQIAINRRRHTVHILVPNLEAGTLYYKGHYLPCEAELGGNGEDPYWVFDTREEGRTDSAIGELTVDSRLDRLYSGSCDGIMRLEDVDGADDDGAGIDFDLVTKHFFMGDQSGHDDHAHTFEELTAFIKAELASWRPSVYVGDEDAGSAAAPQWTPETDVLPSLEVLNGNTSTAKSSHFFLVQRSGKGVTIRIRGTNPYYLRYRGFGLAFRNEGAQPPRSAV